MFIIWNTLVHELKMMGPRNSSELAYYRGILLVSNEDIVTKLSNGFSNTLGENGQ